jgi:hypothetical protein
MGVAFFGAVGLSTTLYGIRVLFRAGGKLRILRDGWGHEPPRVPPSGAKRA